METYIHLHILFEGLQGFFVVVFERSESNMKNVGNKFLCNIKFEDQMVNRFQDFVKKMF